MPLRPPVNRVRAAWFAASTAVILLLGGVSAGAAAAPSPQTASLPAHVRLPRDDAAHGAPTEWWYFNGRLTAVDKQGRHRHYGFEYVIFKFEQRGTTPVYVANFAVTDLTRNHFTYAARIDSYPRPLQRDSFAVHAAGWSMRGTRSHDTLRANMRGYAIRLQTAPAGRAVLHGGDGVIRFAPFGRSAYYSRPSLTVGGVLVDHGVRMRVRGLSWMDHQWGPFRFTSGGGWDWFSLQLADGRRYMLYFLRDRSGAIVETVGTLVGAHGWVTDLPPARFAERATGRWSSPATGITYSSGWRLTVPGGHLVVRPRLRDQEVDVRDVQGVAYWEGVVSVRGVLDGRPARGVGYTEINPAGQP